MLRALTSLLSVVVALGPVDGAAREGAARTPTSEVRIDSGKLRGLILGAGKDVHAYKGIPYAAPPVGENRWKPPQPVQAWSGVRDCFAFGAACPQKMLPLLAGIPEMALHVPTSEDCLYLNVWTPAKPASGKLPVLYWIHGGGFVLGAGSQPLYDGEGLTRLGCVVVSVNYRVGLFGFLAHPALSREAANKVSGNYGLLDQIEGLRWVQRNIAAFGGDPERVTIFGESAGGISVLCLMAAPQTAGLYHAAVAQSATAMDLPLLRETQGGREGGEQIGQRLLAAAGVDASTDARQLRQLSVETLLRAGPTMASGEPVHLGPRSLPLGPIVDGQLIPEEPVQLFAGGREVKVPLIIGSTRDEMSLLLLGQKMPLDVAAYHKQLREQFGDQAEAVAKAYPAASAQQVRAAVVQLTTDISFGRETRMFARAHAAAGHKTYRYVFSRGIRRGFLAGLGAHHGVDVGYLFQRLTEASDVAVGRTMGRYWIQFAAAGDPNGPDLPPWPAYRPGSEEMIEFADGVHNLHGYRNAELDVLERALQATPAANGTKANH
jgi:para-nitrobenzyl esterase